MALSQLSKKRLDTCHPDIQKLVLAASEVLPSLCVLCGHRDEEEQDRAFKSGYSKLKFPQSKHNKTPSRAVDLCIINPDGTIPWNADEPWQLLMKVMKAQALKLGVEIVCGGSWRTRDWPHFELKG